MSPRADELAQAYWAAYQTLNPNLGAPALLTVTWDNLSPVVKATLVKTFQKMIDSGDI